MTGTSGNETLRAGVIGLGSVAETAHLPTYATHPGTVLAAVADPDDGRLRRIRDAYDVDASYGSGEEMLAEANLDLVSICAPPFAHSDLFVAAAEAGCHIYCEKPMTTDAESARTMVEVAEATDVITQIGYTRAYVENYRRVLSIERNQLLGDVNRLETHRIRSPPAGGWNFEPELSGGGVVADQLPHILDFYIRLFGTTPEVTGVTLERVDVPNVEDYARLEFDFDGTPVETTLQWTPHVEFHRNVLLATDGLLEFDMETLTGHVQGETVTQKYGTLPFVDLRGEFRAWWGGSNDFHDRRVHDFVDHVLEGNHDTVAPVQRGLEVTEVLATIYERGGDSS